jgi:hypothetical protein
LIHQNVGTCAPGAKEAGAVESNDKYDMVRCEQTRVRCKKCGSPGAILHFEEWGDGLTYSDYSCSACGYSEVY